MSRQQTQQFLFKIIKNPYKDPLFDSIAEKRKDIRKIVARFGPNIIHHRETDEESYPLIWAFESLRPDVVELLIDEFGARPLEVDPEDRVEQGASVFLQMIINLRRERDKFPEFQALVALTKELFGGEAILDEARERIDSIMSSIRMFIVEERFDVVEFIMRELHVTQLPETEISPILEVIFGEASFTIDKKKQLIDYTLNLFDQNSINRQQRRALFPIYNIMLGIGTDDDDDIALFKWFLEYHTYVMLKGNNGVDTEDIDVFAFLTEEIQNAENDHEEERVRTLRRIDSVAKEEDRRRNELSRAFKRSYPLPDNHDDEDDEDDDDDDDEEENGDNDHDQTKLASSFSKRLHIGQSSTKRQRLGGGRGRRGHESNNLTRRRKKRKQSIRYHRHRHRRQCTTRRTFCKKRKQRHHRH